MNKYVFFLFIVCCSAQLLTPLPSDFYTEWKRRCGDEDARCHSFIREADKLTEESERLRKENKRLVQENIELRSVLGEIRDFFALFLRSTSSVPSGEPSIWAALYQQARMQMAKVRDYINQKQDEREEGCRGG